MKRPFAHLRNAQLGRQRPITITVSSAPVAGAPAPKAPQQAMTLAEQVSCVDPATVAQALDGFLSARTWSEKRAVLEREHTLLLSDMADQLMAVRIAEAQQTSAADRRLLVSLVLHRAHLREARISGIAATWDRLDVQDRRFVPAVRAAPVTVPAPPSLQPLIVAINALTLRRELPQKIRLLGEALARVEADRGDLVLGARLRTELGIALTESPEGDQATNLEQAIACFTEALRVWALADFPVEFAQVQGSLGRIYWWRVVGNPRENLERAIACFTEALRVFTLAEFPIDNARTQNDLGQAYRRRIAGHRRENLERAIACFTEALRVRTLVARPTEYAETQSNLAMAYRHRIAGSHRDNLEQAITCFTEALAIFSFADFPYEYADTQNKLGIVFADRIAGHRRENLERAIACFTEALRVFTLAEFPANYARTQNNLGQAYRRRIAGHRRENLERAIACFTEALRIWTLEQIPSNRATALDSLGEAYLDRIAGDRRENLEQAIACFTEALRIWTFADSPTPYATAQGCLGRAYQARIAGDRRENLEQAIACFTEALRVFTLADFPREYRNTQLDIAWLAYDALVAEAGQGPDPLAQQTAYRQAHEAFAAARQAQADLSWLEYDEQGHAGLQGALPDTREMYVRDAWCLWQLDNLDSAVVALEAGRAHALAESQAIAGVDLDTVCVDHASAFLTARQQWQEARAQGDRPALRAAREAFLEARRAIRAHCQPDFLPSEPTYREIARAAAADQALVYLAATERGGMGLVILPRQRVAEDAGDGAPCVIPLPRLTKQVVESWLTRRDARGNVVGGYQYAVQHLGTELLREWLTSVGDKRDRAQYLATPIRDLAQAIPTAMPTLRAAIENVAATWRAEADLLSGGTAEQQAQAREIRTRLALPSGAALDLDILANDLGWFLQEAELEQLLDDLHMTFVADLREGLDALGLADCEQPIALIPCGRLGVLPIHAAWARCDDQKGERVPFLETCALTLQPSARALAASYRGATALPERGPILAVGDPQPTIAPPLPWAEAEAEAVAILARQAGRRESHAIIGDEATLVRVRNALVGVRTERPGAWVQIASHGHADPADPANCYLLLAHDERLTLAYLHRHRLLDGVRGFVASGCTTGLGDLETAPDELSSFAAGVLQAGAPCAIATLWSVSDRATFLLMLRFTEALLGAVDHMPARALRTATRWMRTATQEQLEEMARRGLKGGRPLQPDTHNHLVDAMRGAIPLTTAFPGDSREGTRMAPTDAFATLAAVPRATHCHQNQPYGHPIYWAAAVIYGV